MPKDSPGVMVLCRLTDWQRQTLNGLDRLLRTRPQSIDRKKPFSSLSYRAPEEQKKPKCFRLSTTVTPSNALTVGSAKKSRTFQRHDCSDFWVVFSYKKMGMMEGGRNEGRSRRARTMQSDITIAYLQSQSTEETHTFFHIFLNDSF